MLHKLNFRVEAHWSEENPWDCEWGLRSQAERSRSRVDQGKLEEKRTDNGRVPLGSTGGVDCGGRLERWDQSEAGDGFEDEIEAEKLHWGLGLETG